MFQISSPRFLILQNVDIEPIRTKAMILQHVAPLPSNDYKQHPLLGKDRGISKYTAAVTDSMFLRQQINYNNEMRSFLRGPCRGVIGRTHPVRRWVDYLHRSPASRRRRRKGNSLISNSKIWSQVPQNSDSKITALATASSNCKRQTRPLVRESAPHQKTRNCLTVITFWFQAPYGGFIPRQTG
jgi:hypothetical protein